VLIFVIVLPSYISCLFSQLRPYLLKSKFEKIAICNSNLDNEKQVLLYQIELIQENVNELEDDFQQLLKQYKKQSQVIKLKI